ncbi:hypothetical protein L249_7107 [Ophiocordyceps polyrhachis-furcata BCC 54312]|uniref:Uncharacterized protein n=1 Tax=Ophiocordyceps polyrhachis-furcata BCC 54312 TaxID=1330021 RepID=A0A367LKK1_9HYPO|nr:hypothetical protein L249_7107 [Ophiocordyceps polyrhachis-furcata BCC 54312]
MFRKKSKVDKIVRLPYILRVDVGAALRRARPRRPTVGRERLRRPPLAYSECPIGGSIGGISVLPGEPRPILVLAGHFAIPGL